MMFLYKKNAKAKYFLIVQMIQSKICMDKASPVWQTQVSIYRTIGPLVKALQTVYLVKAQSLSNVHVLAM